MIESEKQRDLNKLKSIISLFLEELKNDEFTSQISKTDLEEINFLSIFKIIICNIEYLKDEDLIYNFIWCLGILVMGENMDSDYLKETKTLEFLNFILLKSNYKIQSMVILFKKIKFKIIIVLFYIGKSILECENSRPLS